MILYLMAIKEELSTFLISKHLFSSFNLWIAMGSADTKGVFMYFTVI